MLDRHGMTDGFSARLGMPPAPRRGLWDDLPAIARDFVVYRGTANALHLGHRQSADFDFSADGGSRRGSWWTRCCSWAAQR
jgi:hypothetical protein